MKEGWFVTLHGMGDDDYDLLATWAGSTTASYSSGVRSFVSGADLRAGAEQHGITYLMVRGPEGERIGAVDYRTVTYPGSFEIGLAIGDPACWTYGYGADASLTLTAHLFHDLNAHRVQLTMGTFNLPIMQIVARGDLTVEGVLRDYFFLDGDYHDALICSVLRDEFYRAAATGAYSELPDSIPRAEKDRAREVARDTLTRLGSDHLLSLVGRPDEDETPAAPPADGSLRGNR